MNDIGAIIMAAGKGKRMNDPRRQKVLYPVLGKPMLFYILEVLKGIGISYPVIVVGHREFEVRKVLGGGFDYAYQRKRLGTGHAVLTAQGLVDGKFNDILVLAGDQPLFRPQTIQAVIREHLNNHSAITLLSAKVPDPFGLGRIIRDGHNNVKAIREEKEATEEEKKIQEVNLSCYVFKADFLWESLPKIKKSGTGEYYLTDLVALGVEQNQKVKAIFCADPQEGQGVNTPEQLKLVEEITRKRIFQQREKEFFQ